MLGLHSILLQIDKKPYGPVGEDIQEKRKTNNKKNNINIEHSSAAFSPSVPRCVCGKTDSTQSSCDQTAEMFGRQVYLVSPHRFGAARIGAKFESRGSGHEPIDQQLVGKKSQCACRSPQKESWCSPRARPQQLDARRLHYDAGSLRQDGRSCELYPHRVWCKDGRLAKTP